MTTKIITLICAVAIVFHSCSTSVNFTTSEPGADITVNGKPSGQGTTQIYRIANKQCLRVRAEKTGFLPVETTYCYKGATLGHVETCLLELKADDAYESSLLSDYANKDFEQTVSSSLSNEDAWKVISQIVTSYFDNLEMADQVTGYMKTSWQSKSFSQKTIRTRIIVKQSSVSPFKYKIKIISEYSDSSGESVKNDQNFKEWDRILRVYNDLISEFQSRLGAK